MANYYRPSVASNIKGLSRTSALGNALGTGIGGGIASLLQGQLNQMLQRKQEVKQKKERESTASSLERVLGVSPEEATEMSQMNPQLLRSVVTQIQKNRNSAEISNERFLEKQKVKESSEKINNFLFERRKIYKNLKKGSLSRDAYKNNLISSGVDPKLAELLVSEELPEQLRSYFFSKTKGDAKKIKKIAKKYAYKF